MKKTLLTIVAILFTLNITASAQSALDGFDPNANGTIWAVVVQPDGKILIGGEFTTLSINGGAAVTRNRIARLNPDGTLDTAFNPNANGIVYAIAVQADGKIVAGGEFTTIGGQPRNRIARLDATTAAADSFNPNANGAVFTIAVQADGKILAGGQFLLVNGLTHHGICRLDAINGLPDSFDPNANDQVNTIAVQADGKILVGGSITSIGGQARNNIARLDAATGLADSFNPNANNPVYAIAVQADGKIVAGGLFSSVGGQLRNNIARLDAVTGLPDSFDPNANNQIYAIAVQADGKILVGGLFSGASSIGGQARNRIARLDAVTGLADSFNPSASAEIYSIAVQADGKVVVGGFFNGAASMGGQIRNRIARLEADGRLDQTLDLGIVGSQVNTIAVQPDGKILIAGIFSTVLGATRNNIARVNADGTLDTAFDPNANNNVYSIAVQKDGKILVGGAFTNIGGATRNHIARLDATTGAADTFDPNSSGDVTSITVQTDGNILVGGLFANIGGAARNDMARIDAATGLADSFNPNANGRVYSIAVQTDGKLVVGGQFSNIGGATRNYMARLDATTGLADSFDPNGSGPVPEPGVYAVVLQTDGKILACGRFSTIGGQTRNNIARLDAVTGLADSWDPDAAIGLQGAYSMALQADGKIVVGYAGVTIGGQTRNRLARLDPVTGLADSFDPNANNFVYAVAVQADGKILAGGAFIGVNSIGGQNRSYFARLSNDTAALHNLVVTPTTVTWTRGGSSPQFSRVTFESSTDNVNFTSLGNGTVTGSNWTLTGLSLPISQNFYVRARGYYRGSFLSGGDGVTESVRIGFFAPPIITSANGATFTVGTAGTFSVTTTGIPTGASMLLSKTGALPSGVTFVDNSNGTATLAGTPGAGTGGSYPITITANNGVPPNAGQSFTLTVNQPPAITSANSTTFTVGTAGTLSVTTTGFPTGAGMSITETGALPSGVTLVNNNNGTATLAGTPGAGTGGSYPITITANNGISPNGNQTFTLTVNESPGISSANSTTFTIGSAGTFTVTTDRGFPTPPTLSKSGGLPSGVTFTDNGDGTATLAGTPAPGSITRYQFTIIADNAVAPNATQNFTLFINGTTAAPSLITGRIVDNNGAPVEGAVLRLAGTQNRKFITDANGFYRFENVETDGFYTVTPSRVNYSFSPSSRSFSQLGETTEAAFGATLTGGFVNPLDTHEYFVRQHYLDFLGREPDEAGFNFWSDQILECGANTSCIERRRENVSAAYFLSIEFQQTGGLVHALYRASYGGHPDFAQFMPDTRAVGLDVVVGREGWDAKLAANKTALVNAFINRPAFAAVYDGMDNSLFVDTLINHTGVTFTLSERDGLASGLANGTQTRADVLRSIAENDRFVTAKFNEAFVMMEYFGYLRRDPDAGGYAFWLIKLNEFDGNFERADMVKAFIVSGEYRDRFPR